MLIVFGSQVFSELLTNYFLLLIYKYSQIPLVAGGSIVHTKMYELFMGHFREFLSHWCLSKCHLYGKFGFNELFDAIKTWWNVYWWDLSTVDPHHDRNCADFSAKSRQKCVVEFHIHDIFSLIFEQQEEVESRRPSLFTVCMSWTKKQFQQRYLFIIWLHWA